MKLAFSFAPLFLAALAGCTSLGAYGGMMAQPGAATTPAAGSPATAAPSPGAATPSTESVAKSAAKPAAPSSVSVTIRNTCGKTVKVFFGQKPKFGSGTYSTASSNSVQSHSFRPGDLFWIVDQSENGVANVEVKDSTKEIEIRGSCTELAQR
ncbi:MAG: hypothetical protein AMXMBFR56_28840 [Polyangiaceae bacterium]